MITRTILYADEGKVLTDGKTYGVQVILGEGQTPEDYEEISQEVYDMILEAEKEKYLAEGGIL